MAEKADAQRWLATLAGFGVDLHAVSLAMGVDYDTARKWASGQLAVAPSSARGLRAIAVALSMAPGLKSALTLGDDDDVAAAVDSLRVRALLPSDPDRSLQRAALEMKVRREPGARG